MSVKEHPILFSAPMVRALLAGTKTQTRRILKPQPKEKIEPIYARWPHQQGVTRWKPGDRLWVREMCRADERAADCMDGVRYLADNVWIPIEATQEAAQKWIDLFHYRGRGTGILGNIVASIHMPRWASRITLLVTEVRVQRLQDINEADAIAEGVMTTEFARDEHPPSICYSVLWNSINGPGAWDANPWVLVTTFEKVEK